MRARRRTLRIFKPDNPAADDGCDTERESDLADERLRVAAEALIAAERPARLGVATSPSSTVMMRWETPELLRDRDGDRVRRDRTAPRATPCVRDRGNQPVDDKADREGGEKYEGTAYRDGMHRDPWSAYARPPKAAAAWQHLRMPPPGGVNHIASGMPRALWARRTGMPR